MAGSSNPQIALVWSQFADNHVDRCIALGERLDGKAEVLAVEVASTSEAYNDFAPSGPTGLARRVTLFPGNSFDAIPRWRRLIKLIAAVRASRSVYIGVPYSEIDFLIAAWLLRLLGKQVVLMCDSKFDDYSRSARFEFLKRIGLSCYSAVMVAGARGQDYFRFLGFRRRPILVGYDTLSTARIRAAAQAHLVAGEEEPEFSERDFVFVGRMIAKKGIATAIAGFARFCELQPGSKRRLVLIGSGPLEPELRRQVIDLGLEGRVVFTGFLDGPALYGRMAQGLALIMPSYREQWGLVLNEATALGLPVIASEAPGAGDILVRNLINGFVIENWSIEGLARAMEATASDEAEWLRMSAASRTFSQFGDCAIFADSIELSLDSTAQPAGQRIEAFVARFPTLQQRPLEE